MPAPRDDSAHRELLLNAILHEWLQAVDAGRTPNQEALLRGHPDLAAELAAFLADQDRMARLARDVRTTGPVDVPNAPPLVGYFGDYELLEEIARGGMGVVYKARQLSLNRLVAVKMILSGCLATPADVERFRREAGAAAQLDHTNIVPIYEVGEHQGHHYYSMKLIEGHNLGQDMPHFVANHRAAAHMIAQVARAVQQAHERGILHRDLKPGNILLDAAKQPHVADFGLARRLDESSSLSASGAVIGTASYMAPEQAAAGSRHLTAAADIYALGAVLYEMLTGRPPFKTENVVQTLRAVVEQEPERPRKLNPRVHPDLEIICLKCLDKRPGRRYATAAALADDLERWVEGRPIRARRVGPAERLWLWGRRRPVVAGLGAAAAVLLLLAGGLTAFYFGMSRPAPDVKASLQPAVGEPQGVNQENKKPESSGRPVENEPVLDGNTYLTAMRKAASMAERQQPTELLEALDVYLPRPGQPDYRRWEWNFLKAAARMEQSTPKGLRFGVQIHTTLGGNTADPAHIAWSADGRRVAAASSRETIKVLEAATGKEVGALLNATPHSNQIAFRPDGRRLAESAWGKIKIWDVDKATPAKELDGGGGKDVIWSPDGRRLWLWNKGKDVRLWNDADAKDEFLHGHDGEVNDACWSTDGKRLASAGADGTVRIWNVETGGADGEPLQPGWPVQTAAWSPDGAWLAASSGAAVSVWDARTRKAVWEGTLYGGSLIKHLSWTPDNRRLMASGDLPKLIDGATGREIYTAGAGAFSPDGRRLAAFTVESFFAGATPNLRLYDTESGRVVLCVADAELGPLTWSPDGKNLAVATQNGRLQVFAVEPDAAAPSSFNLYDAPALAWSPDGRRYACRSPALPGQPYPIGGGGLVRIGNLPPGEDMLDLRPTDPAISANDPADGIGSMAFSPSGKYLATASSGDVDLWDLRSGKRTWRLRGHAKDPAGMLLGGNGISSLAWSPDDRWVACAAGNGIVNVWDAGVGKLATSFDLAVSMPSPLSLSWSGDGGLLAASADGGGLAGHLVHVWEIPTGKLVHSFLIGGVGGMAPIALRPDGKQLAGGSIGNPLAIWDVNTGAQVKTLDGGVGLPPGLLHWSPDGQRLSYLGRIWDLKTGSTTDVPGGNVMDGCWDPAGQRLLVAQQGQGTMIKAFDADTGRLIKHYDQAPGVVGRPISMVWTKDGPQLAVAHEVHWGPKGPYLVVQTGPGGVGQASADEGVVELVDLDKGRSRFTVKPGDSSLRPRDGVWAMAWKPDGTELAAVHEDQCLRTWDGLNGRQLRRLPIDRVLFTSYPAPYPRPIVTGTLVWAPDGKSIAYAADTGIEIWDLTGDAKGRTLTVGTGAAGAVQPLSLAWSPDCRRLAALASRGRNAVVKLWEASSGKELSSWDLDGQAGANVAGLVAWSPDGKRVAAGVKSVHVWDVDKGKEVFELTGPSGSLARVEWSDDGRRIIGRALPNELVVWDADTGSQVLGVHGPAAGVWAGPDWQWSLAPTIGDNAVHIQKIAPGND